MPRRLKSILGGPINDILESKVKDRNAILRIAEPPSDNQSISNVNYIVDLPPAPLSKEECFPYLPRPSSFHLSSLLTTASLITANVFPDYLLKHPFMYDYGSDTRAYKQRNRFVNPQPMPELYYHVHCGDDFALVHAIGDAHVRLTEPGTGKKFSVLLKKTIFAPTFHTSIVAGYQA